MYLQLVATEKFFVKYWLVLCEKHNLNWVRAFHSGIEITRADYAEVIGELDMISNSIPEIWESRVKDHLGMRIILLKKSLHMILSREDAIAYVG